MDVTSDGSKVQCCKEQYYIGTWNVSFMDQAKSEVVKQEMARKNIDSLRISERKWTEWGPPEKGMANHFSILALRTP